MVLHVESMLANAIPYITPCYLLLVTVSDLSHHVVGVPSHHVTDDTHPVTNDTTSHYLHHARNVLFALLPL